jgi:hypothetical protein
MALPEPTTTSPGKLVLVYGTSTIQHTIGVRYLSGVTMPTASEALTDATALANALKPVLLSTYSITGWRITDPMGAVIQEGVFATAIAGTHATAGGTSNSFTISVTGKGSNGSSGLRVGQTRAVIYPGMTYGVGTGAKTIPAAGDVPLTGFRDHLIASTRYWADFYGQKATARALLPVQHNAHAQRKLGM